MSGDTPGSFEKLVAEAAHEPALLIPGTPLADGRFVVRALLGTGGAGAVYRATDTRRDVDVAVKVLSRVEASGIYGIKQEFRSLSNVRHPNLVALHELYSDRGTWFFTMDLVDGRPASQLRWTVPLVRDVFSQIAGATHAIHQQGKLHRDLKPTNVIVTAAGQVVVLDFGLVCDQAPGTVGRTLDGEGLTGTPAYMAPELATGIASPQSDWYAFGTMLYEALSGRLPFAETGVAVLVRKREEPAPRLPTARGDIPEDLEDLCMRLLERDAARRPGYPEIVDALGAPAAARTAAGGPAEDPFVGREAELRVLEQALLETDRGRSAVVTVSGSPGIGKTRLVGRFLERAREDHGAVAISGRCPWWEHVPFRACDSMVDDLSRYLRALPAERAAAVLPRSTHALTRLFPVLGRLPAVGKIKQRRPLPREPSELKRLGLAALRELIANIAAQERLTVFVDDMQWSDLEGARLLASLVTQILEPEAPAMLLVVAYRTQDADAQGLAAFLERVRSSAGLHVRDLRLRELSAAESRELAVQLLDGSLREGPRDAADRVALEAGGNPLFIRQMVGLALEAETAERPLDLAGVLATRIAGLTPCERRTLDAVCLAERPVSLGLLSQVTGEPDPQLPVRNLASAQLARFGPGPAEVVTAFHDRISEAVVSSMDAGGRRALHARFIEALQRAADPDLAALTLHYVGCGREGDAAVTAVSAARHAASAMAFEQAAAMYRLALNHGRWTDAERSDLVARLAEALVLDRRSGDAGAEFLRAASLEADPARRRSLRLRAADQFLAGGWLGKGIGLLREIFAEVGLDYDAIGRADVLALRRQLAARELPIQPRPVREIPPQTRARLEALRVAGNGLAWLRRESIPIRFVLALEALDAGEPLYLAAGLRTVARFDAQLDPENDEIHRVVLRLCDDNPGTQADLIRPDLETAMAMVRARPWDQLEEARRSEELLLQEPTQDARVLDVARYHQALALFLQGEVQDLDRCWSWLEDAEDRNDVFLGSWLNVLLASQCLARGRVDTAREMCRRASRAFAVDANDSIVLAHGDVLAACDVDGGDASARDRLETALSWFDRSPFGVVPFLFCYVHCVRARTALACALLERPGRSRREELLREVEASIAIATRPRGLSDRTFVLPHYRNLSTLLGAGLAAARGDTASALRGLDRGLEQMSAAGNYSVLSAHARRARGVLLGGAEGETLVAQAEADLWSRGVADPGRHARTVLPGFPS